MAITYVGGSSGGAAGSGQANFNLPAGATAGDLLIFVLATPGIVSVVPSGWTLQANGRSAGGRTYVYTKYATASEPTSAIWRTTADADMAFLSVAYRGVTQIAAVALNTVTSGTAVAAPSVNAATASSVLLAIFGAQGSSTNGYFTAPAGMTTRQSHGPSITYSFALAADQALTSAGPTGTRTATSSRTLSPSTSGDGVSLLLAENSPPLAPTWVTPQNTVVDVTTDFDLDWDPHDPDAGDTQSEYVLDRWTLDGPGGAHIAGSNVRVTVATPNSYRRITAGTLAVGAYEYKVATRDSQGAPTDPAQLVFSESLFVTAAESPDPPTFVAPGPIAGETISTSEREYVISAPDVDASEWTLYADNNGTIDTSTILAGPVTKTTDVRRHTFTGLANNTAVWAQVEIKDGGLWSQPTQQRNPVAYSPPPAPTYTLIEDPAEGEIVIQINNPAPDAGEVATSYNDVFITDPGKPEQRRATEIPANGAWTYQLPPSGFDGVTTGVVRVEAVADNGTRTSSA